MCSNQPRRARHLYAYKWLVTHQSTPAEDVLDIFISTSTTGSSRFRQNKQKRNTFSVLPVNRITTNDNPQPGFVQLKPASTCNAERHLPSSAPIKGRATDNVDHCSHRRASQRFDESHKIRSGHFLHPRFFSVNWSTTTYASTLELGIPSLDDGGESHNGGCDWWKDKWHKNHQKERLACERNGVLRARVHRRPALLSFFR
jgi:hypothetical protein